VQSCERLLPIEHTVDFEGATSWNEFNRWTAAGLPCCGRISPHTIHPYAVHWFIILFCPEITNLSCLWFCNGTPHVHIHMSENAYPTNKVAPNTPKYKKGWTFSRYIKKDQVTDFPSLWVSLTIIYYNTLEQSRQIWAEEIVSCCMEISLEDHFPKLLVIMIILQQTRRSPLQTIKSRFYPQFAQLAPSPCSTSHFLGLSGARVIRAVTAAALASWTPRVHGRGRTWRPSWWSRGWPRWGPWAHVWSQSRQTYFTLW
jgi:hypothetical protein